MELKERLQKLAGIDDIVNKITDIAMKQRRENIIISPKAGFPSSQRFDPTTPLRKKVSFGEDPRKNIGTRNLSLPRERSTLRRLDLERKDATETALDIMNEEKPGRFVNPKTKRIRPPKPTQRQRKEILQAKLQKLSRIPFVKGEGDTARKLIKTISEGPRAVGKTVAGKPKKSFSFNKKNIKKMEERRSVISEAGFKGIEQDRKTEDIPLFREIKQRGLLQRRLSKLAALRPLILKKKKPKRIKLIPVKRAVLTSERIQAAPPRPLTGRDIIGRFKNTGLSTVQKESGFTFLADENRITDAFKPADAQHLRTKFKTPSTNTLAFVSRTKDIKSAGDLQNPLDDIITEGKTPLIGGFNSETRGFEFDATFPMASQNDNEVIEELVKTNQESALAIDPDLSVRFIPNPRFRITSKTNLR